VGVRKKPLKALSLARFARARRVRREKREIFVNSIMRLPDPAHTSCIFDAEVNIPRRGMRVCRYESFSHTGKRKVLLCALCGLEGAQATGREEKTFDVLRSMFMVKT